MVTTSEKRLEKSSHTVAKHALVCTQLIMTAGQRSIQSNDASLISSLCRRSAKCTAVFSAKTDQYLILIGLELSVVMLCCPCEQVADQLEESERGSMHDTHSVFVARKEA